MLILCQLPAEVHESILKEIQVRVILLLALTIIQHVDSASPC